MNRISRIIAILVAASAMGCMTSRNVSLTENRDAASRPEEIEVTSRGGVYAVHWPVVEGDSLRGWQDQKRTQRSSFALADIERARVRQLSGGRTAVVVGLGIVATFVVLILTAGEIAPSYLTPVTVAVGIALHTSCDAWVTIEAGVHRDAFVVRT